jgi:hypothetical protein
MVIEVMLTELNIIPITARQCWNEVRHSLASIFGHDGKPVKAGIEKSKTATNRHNSIQQSWMGRSTLPA